MSSVTTSFARQTPASIRAISSNAQILDFIFPGHCTPVEGVEEGRLFPPSGLHAHMQVEVDLDPEDAFHLLAGQRSDFFQCRSLGADHDRLLAGSLHTDCGEDA